MPDIIESFTPFKNDVKNGTTHQKRTDKSKMKNMKK